MKKLPICVFQQVLVFFLLLQLNDVVAQTRPNQITLENYIAKAVAGDTRLKLVDQDLKIAHERFLLARSSQQPSLLFNVTQWFQFGRTLNPVTNGFVVSDLVSNSFQLTGNWLIDYSKGARSNINANKSAIESTVLQKQIQTDETGVRAMANYLQTLLLKERLQMYENEMRRTHKHIAIIKEAVAVGKASSSAQIAYETKLIMDSSNYLDARLAYQTALISLKQAIKMDQSDSMELVRPDLSKTDVSIAELGDPELVYTNAMNVQLVNKLIKKQIESLEHTGKAIRSNFLPMLTFNYGVYTLYANLTYNKPIPKWWENFGTQVVNNLNHAYGLTLTFPILNNRQYKTSYHINQSNIQKLQIAREVNSIQLKEEIYTAVAYAAEAYQKTKLSAKITEGYRQLFDRISARFDFGTLGIQELINAQNELSRAELKQLNDELDLYLKLKVIQYYKTRSY